MVSLNANDKYNALIFLKNEMNQIWKATNLRKRDDIGNWLILGSNKLFSDFGQSLGRPLAWLFGVHSVLYFVLIMTVDLPVKLTMDFDEMSLAAFWEGAGIYLNLLSPVHSDTIKGASIFGVTDFFMRLSAGFFLYYFLRSTRKFNFGT